MLIISEIEMLNELVEVLNDILEIFDAEKDVELEEIKHFVDLLLGRVGQCHKEVDVEVVIASQLLIILPCAYNFLLIACISMHLSQFLHTFIFTS